MRYVAKINGLEFQINLEESGVVIVDDASYAVDLQSVDGGFHYSLLVEAVSHEVFVEHCDDVCFVILGGHRYQVRVEDERSRRASEQVRLTLEDGGEARVTSPMPGVVVAVLAKEGQLVKTGESLAILEAMKMENEIRASLNGVVDRVYVTPGQRVSQGDDLFRIGVPGAGSEDSG